MTSFGLYWSQNGGSSVRSISEGHHCYGGSFRTQAFLKKANKIYSLDRKSPQQSMALNLHRSRANSISNSYVDSPQIHSEPTYHGDCEIYKFHPNKRVADKEDNNISKTLDHWVRNSIPEIVNNIEQAPFLVHIYSDDGGEESSSTTAIRLEKEKADAENWPLIRGRWEAGNNKPNGIILVEELNDKEFETSSDAEVSNNTRAGSKLDSTTRLWGVLIQVKGENRTACYILKTSTVNTSSGFCTHFCLAKIKCFDESAEIQLRKLWLQT